MWSLGVIFYVIVTGVPLYGRVDDAAFQALEMGRFDEVVDHYNSMGSRVPQGWVRDMIRSMLHPIPLLRPSAHQISATISEYQEVASKLRLSP